MERVAVPAAHHAAVGSCETLIRVRHSQFLPASASSCLWASEWPYNTSRYVNPAGAGRVAWRMERFHHGRVRAA